jgi:hypothetical protein
MDPDMKIPLMSPLRLRGHHLICLHFFSGEGYNFEFIGNLKKILERAESGEEIEICSGADDICRKCPHLKGKRCFYDKDTDGEIREMDRKAIKLLRLSSQKRVKWMKIRDEIPEIIHEWSRDYCETCGWRKACEATFPAFMRYQKCMDKDYSRR